MNIPDHALTIKFHFWARKLLLKSHFAPFNGIIKSLSELFGHFGRKIE